MIIKPGTISTGRACVKVHNAVQGKGFESSKPLLASSKPHSIVQQKGKGLGNEISAKLEGLKLQGKKKPENIRFTI